MQILGSTTLEEVTLGGNSISCAFWSLSTRGTSLEVKQLQIEVLKQEKKNLAEGIIEVKEIEV